MYRVTCHFVGTLHGKNEVRNHRIELVTVRDFKNVEDVLALKYTDITNLRLDDGREIRSQDLVYQGILDVVNCGYEEILMDNPVD